MTRDQYAADQAWGSDSFGPSTKMTSIESVRVDRTGWTLGGGAEFALTDRWSVKADYSFTRLASQTVAFANARAGVGQNYTTQTQTGTTIVPPSPRLCERRGGEFCLPREVPVYTTTTHPGSSTITNGRSATDEIDLHTLKIGLNYKF
mgnify:FL=1